MTNESTKACALAVLLGGAVFAQGCEQRYVPFPEEQERSVRNFEEKRLEGRQAEESYGHERARAERLDFLEAARARLDGIERSVGSARGGVETDSADQKGEAAMARDALDVERAELRKSIERAPDVSAIDWQAYKLLTSERLDALERSLRGPAEG